MGLLIPDLEQELNQRERRQPPFLLEVPRDIAKRFRVAALADRPEFTGDYSFDLGELSDAFVLNFGNSTKLLGGDPSVSHRIPPLEQYLNLLKSVWIYQRIRQHVPVRVNIESDSHWPSFVGQLEDVSLNEPGLSSKYYSRLINYSILGIIY